MRQVACPVALHPDGVPLRITAFAHPLAGLQLIKGGLKDGESPPAGAARELFEESGLETTSAIAMGSSTDISEGEDWHFALFKFQWLPLDAPPPDGFHPKFLRAFEWIKATL